MENCKIVFVKLGFCQGQVEVKVTEPDKNSKTEMHLYVHHRSNMYLFWRINAHSGVVASVFPARRSGSHRAFYICCARDRLFVQKQIQIKNKKYKLCFFIIQCNPIPVLNIVARHFKSSQRNPSVLFFAGQFCTTNLCTTNTSVRESGKKDPWKRTQFFQNTLYF